MPEASSRTPPGHVAVVGAGPCGLACARELERLGHREWSVYEAGTQAGGHAGSVVDPQGFTWDFGGHVVFSHYGEFDALLEEVMGGELYEHERSSYVRFGDRWVPYPFQNNLRHLPPEVAYECVLGLVESRGAGGAVDFATWMENVFGAGITRHFMRSYNFKVWATPPERMSADWIAERVSVVDYRRALRNVLLGQDDPAWGPNDTFLFPRSGGTGEIYRRVASRLGARVEFGREVVAVDPRARRLRFRDGSAAEYGTLVSTMPLDRLVACLTDCPRAVRDRAAELEHNSVVVVGVGYELPLDDDRSWMYFPEDRVPFYRVTNFAKYAPANVPGGDVRRHCSYMTETSYSSHKPEDRASLAERVLEGLVTVGVVPEGAPVASVHEIDAEHAYPVPTLGLRQALDEIQPWLMEQGIYSRGRFGAWRYELGNMDHAVKMGIDVARLVAEGRPEEVWS